MNKLYTLLHSIVNTLNRVVRDKVDTSQLNTEVNNALNTAKESGQFDGAPGKDGASVTHEWEGTTLKITSASGTTSADLKGETGNSGVHFGSDEPKDDSSKVWIDLSGQGDVLDYIPSPDTAEVGQTMVVKAVDENGKPTQWEVADLPTNTTFADYELIAFGTTTEEVDGLTINKDINGNAFALKECICIVQGTISGTCANTVNGSLVMDAPIGNANTIILKAQKGEPVIRQGYLNRQFVNQYSSLAITADDSGNISYSGVILDNITSIVFRTWSGGVKIGAGTNYALYGVRL